MAEKASEENKTRTALMRIAAGLVHDLQHPIQSIENACKNWDRAIEDHALRETLRNNLVRELNKIKRLLNDLHHITQEIPYLPVRFSVATVLRELESSFTDTAGEKGIAIRWDCEPNLEIEADKFSLNRLLSNLLANAIQAVNAGNGVIEVRANQEDSMAVIAVSDNGKGIPSEDLQHIFEEFWTTKPGGLGLGLAIAKRIAKQHGGRICTESSSGKGTCFKVYLPLASPALASLASASGLNNTV